MHLIWHGTASIEAVCEAGRVLFDPFVPFKGSPVKVDLAEFDGFSDIFVTHCHFDHVMNLPELVRRNPDVVIHWKRTSPCSASGTRSPSTALRSGSGTGSTPSCPRPTGSGSPAGSGLRPGGTSPG